MRVLGIETSCDETGIAIFDDQKGILSHQLYSQVKLHADYGGVVPELASRDHVRKTIPLIQAALQEAGLGKDDIDGIAYTAGPGLVGAILVGATIGRFAGDGVEQARHRRSSHGRPSAGPHAGRARPRVPLRGAAGLRWSLHAGAG